MPKKVLLTGIRASSEIHLGNYLGAMQPGVTRQSEFESYFFIANLHGLTTTPPPDELRKNTLAIAAAWLAAGIDPSKVTIWKQSDVHQHVELSYFLACVTGMGLLERAHSYKDALAKSKLVKVGLFYYPVLMAADILLYNADLVPVGKDQAQHLEMARDMATFFNEAYGEVFKLPEALISEKVAIVPGIDGRKMSKSYGNGILPFAPEAELKKQVMGIKTDSKSLDDPKVADECLVFQIYKLIATPEETQDMKSRLEKGGYGYGDAKKTLLSKILETFGSMRKDYNHWLAHPDEVGKILAKGAELASEKAEKMMKRVREVAGV